MEKGRDASRFNNTITALLFQGNREGGSKEAGDD